MKQRIELVASLAASEVADRLRRASREEGWNRRVLAFYLHDMHERRLFLASGHANTAHFAEAQLEMSARCCREHIQVGRELRNLELLDEAFRDDAITWSKVVLLLRVIQRETQHAWVELAKRWPYLKLRDEVMGCRPGDLPGEGDDYGLQYQKQEFGAAVPDELMKMIEETRVRLSKPDGELLSNAELLEQVFQHMQHCGGHPPTPEPVPTPRHDRNADHHSESSAERHADSNVAQSSGGKAKSNAERGTERGTERNADRRTERNAESTGERNDEPIPDETRDHVLRRDGHRCCNCRTQFEVEIHHIEFRTRGGTNHPSNLVTLCKTCHASIHRSLLLLHGNPEHAPPTFLSADGTPIARASSNST